jgi:hypothetical protein
MFFDETSCNSSYNIRNFLSQRFSARFLPDTHTRGRWGTTAVGFVTLPPLVLAPLPLGWPNAPKV